MGVRLDHLGHLSEEAETLMDHVDAPSELMDPPPCDCCGVPSTDRRSSIWHQPYRICHPCFWIWYEYGLVSQVRIKAARLKRYGTQDIPAGQFLDAS